MEESKDNILNIYSELNGVSDKNIHTIANQQILNVEENATRTLTSAYHLSEIKQNQMIIDTAKKIIWARFGIISIGIVFAFVGKTDIAIITAISGIVTEFISAIIFAFVTMSNKSKLQYFEQLSVSEEGEKHMQMILTLDNKKAQEKLIDKMVTNYCERRK